MLLKDKSNGLEDDRETHEIAREPRNRADFSLREKSTGSVISASGLKFITSIRKTYVPRRVVCVDRSVSLP